MTKATNLSLLYHYSAELIRVVDGDTCVLRVDLGFSVFVVIKARLFGINCPEMSTPAGPVAKQFAEDWFLKANLLTIQSHGPDKYNRWDVTIWGNKDGVSLNDAILASGNAVVMKS